MKVKITKERSDLIPHTKLKYGDVVEVFSGDGCTWDSSTRYLVSRTIYIDDPGTLSYQLINLRSGSHLCNSESLHKYLFRVCKEATLTTD